MMEIVDKLKEIEKHILSLKEQIIEKEDEIAKLKLIVEETVYNDKNFKNADMRRIAVQKMLNNNAGYQQMMEELKVLKHELGLVYIEHNYHKRLFDLFLKTNNENNEEE